jgi:MFS family permease
MARVLQGISAAFTWTCSMSSLSRYYPSTPSPDSEGGSRPQSARHQAVEQSVDVTGRRRSRNAGSNAYTSVPQQSGSSGAHATEERSVSAEEESAEVVQIRGGAVHASPMLGFALGVANAGSAVGGFIGAPLGGLLYQASDSFFGRGSSVSVCFSLSLLLSVSVSLLLAFSV